MEKNPTAFREKSFIKRPELKKKEALLRENPSLLSGDFHNALIYFCNDGNSYKYVFNPFKPFFPSPFYSSAFGIKRFLFF